MSYNNMDCHDNTTFQTSSSTSLSGTDIECNICCRRGSETEIPTGKVTPLCLKERTVCKDCLQKHIRNAILFNRGRYDNIRCICTHEDCPLTLDYGHIQKYADEDTFRRFDEALLCQTLDIESEFFWCSRLGCGSGQIHYEGRNNPEVICHACGHRSCFTHKCDWHEGLTCEQYDAAQPTSTTEPSSSSGYLQCPKCSHGIEKLDGCDHVTCRCGHEFCWICQAPYEGPNGIWKCGNSVHKNTCRHYRPET